MTSKDEYINSLKWRLNNIKDEIALLQKTIQELFNDVEKKQEQAQNLMMLLKAEGIEVTDPELASLADVAIADVAYDLLAQSNKKPIHYNELAKVIMAKGILIPGKNPASNLLAHINRDERFVRTAPGTYGLKEWGVQEMPARKRSTRRKRKGASK